MSLFNKNNNLEHLVSEDLKLLNRRSFLVRGSLMVAIAGSGVLTACSGTHQDASALSAGKVLDSDQMAFFHRAVTVMLPTQGTSLTPVEKVPVLQNIDHLLSLMHPDIRSNLTMALNLFEYGGWVMGWHFSRFTRMNTEDSTQYIESWQNGHPMQQGIVSVLKRLVYSSYWRDESTWVPLQFDGPVSDRWGLPSLGEAPLPEYPLPLRETV